MEMAISAAAPATIGRIAQLTQKTNQFNLTTRRYSEEEIRKLSQDPLARVFGYSVRDRFGDNGLVGVAIVRAAAAATWEIDTFLLSCRVIGRTVETAMMGHLSLVLQLEQEFEVSFAPEQVEGMTDVASVVAALAVALAR